jgi:amino acid transporter
MARRHVSTGALYTLIPKGLGPSGGLLTMGGFALIAVAGQIISVIGFGASFAQFLSSAFNIGTSSHLELVFLDLAGLFVATIVVLRGIGLSTKVLFGLEGSAMVAILLLLAIVLIKHGHIIDHAQLGLHGASAHGVLLGMTFIVLSFGGFESAASLGVEARRPRRAVPIALIGSIAIAGVFFLLNGYIQILGFEGTGLKIASQAIPLGTLASHYGVGWLGDVVLLGVALSWFGVLVAWMNYAPRVTLTMADEGVLPNWLGRTNKRTGSPVGALIFWVSTWLVLMLYFIVAGTNLSQAFGNIGYLAGYGYTLLYLVLAIAAIRYAFIQGLLKAWFLIAAVVAGGVMILEFWYSFHPLPAYPVNWFVYGFGAYVALLLVACVVSSIFAPRWLQKMGKLEEKADV